MQTSFVERCRLPRLARPLRAGALGPILRANLMSVRVYLVSCLAGPNRRADDGGMPACQYAPRGLRHSWSARAEVLGCRRVLDQAPKGPRQARLISSRSSILTASLTY